jgi:hypothetical protein
MPSWNDAEMHRYAGSLSLIVTLGGTLIGAPACAVGVRVYDEPRRDYHRWDEREDRAYRAYLAERHREYREFKTLERREQEEYWEWRHAHPDRDRDKDRDRERSRE